MNKLSYRVVVLIMAIAGILQANYSNTGQYMFTASGNDANCDLDGLVELAENWFLSQLGTTREIDFALYLKVDAPATDNGGLAVTYEGNPNESQSGSWSADSPVEFYSVKAANQFALYWVENGAISGYWSTEDLLKNGQQPSMSHFCVWNPLPPVVPEPCSIGLAILGLASIAKFRQKLHRN